MTESLYAWQVFDHDERWGTIAATVDVPGLGPTLTLLVARTEDIARLFTDVAHAHGETTGNPVALRRFEFVEDVTYPQ